MKLKKKIYNIFREYLKKHLTDNLGSVVEEDDKLVCYVSKIKHAKGLKHTLEVTCYGIKERDKDLAKSYNLNKPIDYVFDGLDIKESRVRSINGYDCNIIIKNCNFDYGLRISVIGNCILEKTSIRPFFNLLISARELAIKDMKIEDPFKFGSLDISLESDNELKIINSSIGNIESNTRVYINSLGKLQLENSKIMGDSISCKSNKIVTDENSSLEAKDKVEVKTEEFDKINIKSPILVYNGESISNNKEIVLENIKDPLSIKRQELIRLLKEIKTECKKDIDLKTSEYISELENESIVKVLK